MNLGIVKIQRNSRTMEGIAVLYCRVFSEDPWREANKPAYVLKTMNEQFEKPNAIALAVIDIEKEDKPVAFGWAYELFESDLGTEQRHSSNLRIFFEEEEQTKRIFYLQELGVDPTLWHKGIGENFLRNLLARIKVEGADLVILSTNCNAETMIALIKKIGFQNTGISRPPETLGRTYWKLVLDDFEP